MTYLPGCIRLCSGLLLAALPFFAAAAEGSTLAGHYKDCNLLIISLTNIGAEHMSLYGYGRKTTPDLDKWAGGALVFEDAFTQASWTLPAATSLFTSLYPYTHRLMDRNRGPGLAADLKTLPEVLGAAGYRTAAFTGGLDYAGSLGHMRGFQTAPDNPPFTRFSVTLPQASRWLSRNSDKKFFLFVHGYDPHPPFAPGSRFKGVFSSTEGKHVTVDPSFVYRGYTETENGEMTVYYHVPKAAAGPAGGAQKRDGPEKRTVLTRDDMDHLRGLYDEVVLDVDRAVGDFLGSLDAKLLDRTVVVVLSEHGEMFAKHGRFGRAGAKRGTLYDDVVHVPLLIRAPGVRGGRVRGLAQLVDVMPTILELLAAPAPDQAQGRSLLPLISGGKPVNEFVYAGANNNFYTSGPAPSGAASLDESIRDGRWKLIHEVTFPDPKEDRSAAGVLETFKLYDIRNDPGETVNAAGNYPGVVKDLSEKLKRWAKSSTRSGGNRPSRGKLPEAVLESAKEHGYW